MNLQTGPWGGGNQFGNALVNYLRERGASVSFDLTDPALDLIVLAEPRAELSISAYTDREIRWYVRHVNPRALVVHRINECDERKNTQGVNALLMDANRCADHTVFISSWLRDLFLGHGLQMPEHSVILNGADSAIFHSRGYQPWNKSEPLKLVTHHWGTNRLKGFDIYETLDTLLGDENHQNRVAFTYIGQLPPDFSFRHARYLEPLSGTALASELRQHHVYLTASQHEPAGMHHIEGAMCGLPLLYRESGALPEYCAGFGLGFTAENFHQQLEAMIGDYDEWRGKMPDYAHTAERMCRNYHDLFVDMLSRRDAILQNRQPERIAVQTRLSSDDKKWLGELKPNLKKYLDSLKIPGQPGRFLPAAEGLTAAGESIVLPFSCFALKVTYMLGLWDELPQSDRDLWLRFIQDFQVDGNPTRLWVGQNAFIDRELYQWVKWQVRRSQHVIDRILFPRRMSVLQRMVSAETKQAIASLAQVGARTDRPYMGFPKNTTEMRDYLNGLNWSRPWEAGAHVATIAVFLRTEAPRFLPEEGIQALLDTCNGFIDSLADAQTGAYFRGDTPGYGQLINGAMKILTALDWLETPIHYPERLIDTCLSAFPQAEGCHLVDAVYVLHRCLSDYRRADVREYCLEMLKMIRAHHNPSDGGFSYFIGRSQSHYQRVRITKHYPVSDIHGTVLLVWALVMILHILDENPDGWRIMKP